MKQPQSVNTSGDPSPRILRTLLLLGHLLLIACLLTWLICYLTLGAPYQYNWWIILSAIFLGRAAAVGSGLEMGFSPIFLFFQTAFADLLITFYVYPIFVRGYRHLTRVPYIGGYLDNLHQVALSYESTMKPYGIVGLMLFVIFPFWSTGALVGAILGFLIGLPVITTLVSVTVGNLIAIGAWVWLYNWLTEWNRGVAVVVLVLIFAVAIMGIVVGVRNKRRQKRNAAKSVDRTVADAEASLRNTGGTVEDGFNDALVSADKNSADTEW
ncbi:MAG: putative small multi-drug export protein [Candidatus Hydrogenedentes bacterium ADurb.Bin101]|nr:MAG: putative small multi-drug export protein [Candidatus Hydrogenedentes bacterium ADurb.Bin101]